LLDAFDGEQTAMIEVMRRVSESRAARTVFLVEDVHWVDGVSEEVLAAFAATLTGTRSG